MIEDTYQSHESRTVLFKYKRYRLIKNNAYGTFMMFYGNRLLKMGDRGALIDHFKKVMEEARGINV